MRESSRAEVRRIAGAAAFETVMHHADAFARTAYAEKTMAATARRVAERVARAVAGERVARAEEIVRSAEGAAEDVAARTAEKVAESASAETLKRALAAVEEELGDAWEALEESRTELTRTVGAFARDEAARVVAEVAAETVPPVVEVRVGAAPDAIRVGGHTHAVFPDLVLALGAGCHVLLVGPAGTGKSMMAQQAAEAFGQEFHALSLGPTTPMSKIFGYYDAHGNYHGTPFRRAFEHGGLMLLDELDSGHPGLLAELNQALSIRSCAFADGMVRAHPDFRLVATANTYGTGGDRQYVGRQALDAATLDRFAVVDVPVDEDLEERVTLAHAPDRADDAREVLAEVRRLRATAADKRLPVMFSPRACIDAARLLQAGASVEQAMRWRVVRGMSEAHRSALGL
ncbi:AAA family ATPase [Spirillospora sp. NPDC052242]